MKFTPKTEEEVLAKQLCPEGKYPFTVLESSEVVCKSEKNLGKPMIKLKLNVHADDGFDYHVYDYIADWFMEFKLRHFAFSVGQGLKYESGILDANSNAFQGFGGWCDVGIQKSKNGQGPKNVIQDYVVKSESLEPKPKPEPEDDVPF